MLGLLFFGILKTLTLILWIIALALGLKWIKATTFSWWKITLAGLVIIVGFQVINGILIRMMTAAGLPWVASWGLIAVAYVISTIVLVAGLFQLPPKNAVLVSLPTFAPMVGMLLVINLILTPYVFEAYKIPSSAMSPTLLGRHIRAECPECGATRYGSAPRDYISDEFFEDVDMICDNFHITQGCPPTDEFYSGDRILVSKRSTPKRWDLLVFRYPENPQVKYIMRLVGMPGETIHIENGSVYADGKPLTLPPELEGIRYADHMEGLPIGYFLWGTVDEPAKLEDDEYFVLGDFTTNAKDSRLWRSPAKTGLSPYAVPQEYIIGIATEIYWPYDRWRPFP
ncbi:signal peptidase I [Bremerella sp. P1]|uniref:signal peptidase I n=1 Tax=Bremerella sp. P1 TaxID=3026424 RepID=UPI0023677B3C|nr:signal peptidase I [Bremerella sp. P1]WDI39844.1 signal peptidase I [Bremerella sp. P1]